MSTLSPDQSGLLNLTDQTLIELLPIAAYAVRAPDGVLIWFNSRAAELWGREPVIGDLDERFCGSHRLYYPDGSYMAHSHTPVALALKTGVSVHEEDVVIERPDGSRVTVSVHIDPLRDSQGSIVGVVNFFHDITERKAREDDIKREAERLEAAVQHRTASLRTLSSRLLQLQDEERRRITRELHDGTGQLMAAAKMTMDKLARAIAPTDSTALPLAKEVCTKLDDAIRELRTLAHLFHPPLLDELGFSAAVRLYVEGFRKRSEIETAIELPPDLPRLPQAMETALFRIVQESLTNVHRHSGASKAAVSVTLYENLLRLEIRDNGKGFDPTKRNTDGVGITSIRERLREMQGTLDIRCKRGTLIIAELPLPPTAYRVAATT